MPPSAGSEKDGQEKRAMVWGGANADDVKRLPIQAKTLKSQLKRATLSNITAP